MSHPNDIHIHARKTVWVGKQMERGVAIAICHMLGREGGGLVL